MSGHSKWSNIKRTKEKTDAQKGKIFTKIGREIAVCVKAGGSDPSVNSKLADIIQKARQNNMPNDTIMRSIKKAAGELSTINYEEITYEGYGPGGSAVLVKCLTDNKNRTAGDVRHIFDKYGNGLGTTNSVWYLFNRLGLIVVDKEKFADEDELMVLALEAGADDLKDCESFFEIYTQPSVLQDVVKTLQDAKVEMSESGVKMIASMLLDLGDETSEKFFRLVDALEELDDVQEVYHNVN